MNPCGDDSSTENLSAVPMRIRGRSRDLGRWDRGRGRGGSRWDRKWDDMHREGGRRRHPQRYICFLSSLILTLSCTCQDLTRQNMTWHDMTWNDMTWYDMSWESSVLHDTIHSVTLWIAVRSVLLGESSALPKREVYSIANRIWMKGFLNFCLRPFKRHYWVTEIELYRWD